MQMFPETQKVIVEDLYEQVGGNKEVLIEMILAQQEGGLPQLE